MEQEEVIDEYLYEINWEDSDLDLSEDDEINDPDFEISKMLNNASIQEPESDYQSDAAELAESASNTVKNSAKRRRAKTIDTRPKKRNRVMPITYTEAEVDIEVIPPLNGKISFSFALKFDVFSSVFNQIIKKYARKSCQIKQ